MASGPEACRNDGCDGEGGRRVAWPSFQHGGGFPLRLAAAGGRGRWRRSSCACRGEGKGTGELLTTWGGR
jgi:hypothetical protein